MHLQGGFMPPQCVGLCCFSQPYPLELPPCLQVMSSHPGTAVRHYFRVGNILRRNLPLLLASSPLLSGLRRPAWLFFGDLSQPSFRGCLPKSRATHCPRDMIDPGFSFLAVKRWHRVCLPQEPGICPSTPHFQQLLLRSGPRQSVAMWPKPRQWKHRFISFFLRTLQDTHPILMWATLTSFMALASSKSTYTFLFTLQGDMVWETLNSPVLAQRSLLQPSRCLRLHRLVVDQRSLP